MSDGEGAGFLVGGGATVFFGGAGVLLAGAVLFFGAVAGAFDSLDGVAAGFLEGVAEGAADFDGVFEALPEGDFETMRAWTATSRASSKGPRALAAPAGGGGRTVGRGAGAALLGQQVGALPARTWSAAELPPEV
ncbi:putative protein OS=Streptomyces microflavus OX=1919 GN=Smic_60620 PE=4 SV=1 [Streptomyces microflavus]